MIAFQIFNFLIGFVLGGIAMGCFLGYHPKKGDDDEQN